MHPTAELLAELRSYDGADFIEFSAEGLRIKLSYELREWFEENHVTNEAEFAENRDDFPAEDLHYFANATELLPLSIGLTDAPGFAYGGMLGNPEYPPRYAFVFFERYQTTDWVQELLRNDSVLFESFVDFTTDDAESSP